MLARRGRLARADARPPPEPRASAPRGRSDVPAWTARLARRLLQYDGAGRRCLEGFRGKRWSESDRRRLITSTPHLTPDQIVQRTFATSFRGYSEAEVRAFLKRVSEELVVTHDRELELLEHDRRARGAAAGAAAARTSPRCSTRSAPRRRRLLRSAREAADEIRAKAEERATQIIDEARAEAERLTAEADEGAGRGPMRRRARARRS